MGECGCTIDCPVYKLKAPDGWYFFKFLHGCSYCDVGPGIHLLMPDAARWLDDIESIPLLPVIGTGGDAAAVIKCGLDKTEAEAAMKTCLAGTEIDDGRIDSVLAEILGDELWQDALCTAPSAVVPKR